MLDHVKILAESSSGDEFLMRREQAFEEVRAKRAEFEAVAGPIEEEICKRQEEFFQKYGWEDLDVLEDLDKELAHNFAAQHRLFVEAVLGCDIEQLQIHGPALLRGFDAVFARVEIEQRGLNFNKAAEQRGLGPHPGKPPPRGSRYKWWYHKYLNSAEWSDRRSKVMKRCDQTCEGCGENPATEVHHKTYDHVGYEFLFELLGLCRDCHARFHNK